MSKRALVFWDAPHSPGTPPKPSIVISLKKKKGTVVVPSSAEHYSKNSLHK